MSTVLGGQPFKVASYERRPPLVLSGDHAASDTQKLTFPPPALVLVNLIYGEGG
jgi:hypothetical protein